MRLNALSENLQISRNHGIGHYKKLDQYARAIRSQRNWITHNYGLPGEELNWGKIWRTVNYKIEKKVLPELIGAIEKECKLNLVDYKKTATTKSHSTRKVPDDHTFKTKSFEHSEACKLTNQKVSDPDVL